VKDSLLGYEKATSLVASMWAELEREEDSKQDAVETGHHFQHETYLSGINYTQAGTLTVTATRTAFCVCNASALKGSASPS